MHLSRKSPRFLGPASFLILAAAVGMLLSPVQAASGYQMASSTIPAPVAMTTLPLRETIITGGDENYPPFQYLGNGVPTGFNVDLMHAVAAKAGLKLIFQLGPWSDDHQHLADGKIDIIEGMLLSDEREKIYNFSLHTAQLIFDVFVPENSSIHTLNDIRNKRILVQNGGILHDYSLQNSTTPYIIPVIDGSKMLKLLCSGSYECGLLNKVQGLYYINQFKITNLKNLNLNLMAMPYAMAVRNGDTHLLVQLNNGINLVIESDQFQKISQKWLGAYAPPQQSQTSQHLMLALLAIVGISAFFVIWTRTLQRLVKNKTLALSESEAKYRLLVENASEGVVVLIERRTMFVNARAMDLSGYDQNELVGSDISKILHPEDRKRVLDSYDEIFQGRQTEIRLVFRIRTRYGSFCWISTHAVSIIWEGHAGILILFSDVTAEKAMQEALQASEERFKTFFQEAPLGYLSLDAKGYLLEVNHTWLDLMGYQRTEVIGRWFGDFLTPHDREIFPEKFNTFKPQGITHGLILEMVRNDSTTFIASIDGKISMDENGGFLHIHCIFTDITEKYRAEQALRASEDRFSKVFLTSPDSININRLDDGKYIEINQGFTQITGYTRADALGKNSDDIHIWVNPQDRKNIAEKIRQTGQVNNYEALFRKKNGETIVGLFSGRIIEIDGQPCILSISRDISDKKKGEEQQRFLSQFPEQNPNPVIRINRSGMILYANPISAPVLEMWQTETGKEIPDNLKYLLIEPIQTQQSKEFELIVAANIYIVVITPIKGEDYLNLYFSNITQRKKAEQNIQRQLQRLAALRTIDSAITASMDMRLTLHILLEQVTNQLEVDAAAVLLLNPGSLLIQSVAESGFRRTLIADPGLHLGKGYAGIAALERHIIRDENLNENSISNLTFPQAIDEGYHTYLGIPLVAKGVVVGVLELYNRNPFPSEPEWASFLEALAAQAAIALENATLFEDLQKANSDLTMAYDATIEGWAHALELRDGETEGHSQRVSEMAVELARAMGISEDQLIHVRRGTLLHDIGKMGIPDSILLKPAPLTADEWKIMRQHPTYALELLSGIDFLKPAMEIPYCHHERWNGTGYPCGLKQEEIPITARIFAVVDVWDALRSDRPYRLAWKDDQARAYLRELSGIEFDPKVVEMFLSVF